ncbi:hypothetical protein NHX12_024675 [Muraenolepis orangiensis]|uniref:Uncharacterized protein n=1 Tax=Muraenolepis orangiensis TaxID=630683 RepID=A0A9Q0EHZ0_9TELE|nr:hypothetical protein NHX12_024675 [Muraenolepis orangiensis]
MGDEESILDMMALGGGNLLNMREPKHWICALHLAATRNYIGEKNTHLELPPPGFLLSLGSQPNTQDHKGRTPAMLAAEQGHEPALTLLAENHADMNLLDAEGKGEKHRIQVMCSSWTLTSLLPPFSSLPVNERLAHFSHLPPGVDVRSAAASPDKDVLR